MSDDFRQEEKQNYVRKEEPHRMGSTFVKYTFITIITAAILFFIAIYLLPFLSDLATGSGGGGADNGGSKIELDINSGDGGGEGGGGGGK